MGSVIHAEYWPLVVLLLSIGMVILLISRFHIHPFIALILSAIFTGLISPALPDVEGQDRLVTVVELPMIEFGIMAGKIAWVIALAAVIGTAMMESGAADEVVRWLLRTLGESRAAIALLITGFVLSVPVFFDTVFFLLIPIGITLAKKTGRDFVLYVVATAGGAAISHSIVPPTPGPLIMAETLDIALGTVMFAGIVAGIFPGIMALITGHVLNKRLNIPLRVSAGEPNITKASPSLMLSILPIAVPVLMISGASVAEIVAGSIPSWLALIGNKNVAMAMGAFIAIFLWARMRKLGLQDLRQAMSRPLEVAGVIILITSAGGAFGAMINHIGIGAAIGSATDGFDLNYILLAWVIAAVMKIAQGSGTVSMITSAAIMSAMIPPGSLPYHPVYILLSIGFGSNFISWMNDSGFWVVTRMSGFTEKEGLQTWTVTLATISVAGLLQLLLLSWAFPLL